MWCKSGWLQGYGFFGIYEVLKWFTPCWTSDFFRYIMKDMILDLLQCAIPWSWDCWVFWVGDNQQHLFPPIRFYNGYCTIGFTWSMLFLWYDSVLWDANLVDCRAMCFFEFMRFWIGLPHVGPVISSGISWRIWFLDLLQCAIHCFLGLLGIWGGR